ncbi:hypothetical protein HPB47_013090 [Ixodes persulcatus]|uniref:Uncharacterized protein n=1 Tax=Ixodes persulcatus TaxID=34615 RepID=A0AC60NRS2_IXOPE|nr:hypothetical protein HPB47_013090 [Ixodes persulcatus]
MNFGLTPPLPFLQTPGQPPVPWQQWEQTFLRFLEASGAEEFKASRRAAILLHCLGVERQRQYNVMATSTPPLQQPTTEAEGKSATAASQQAASALQSADAAVAEVPETRPVASSATTETADMDSVSASTVPAVPETSVACSESEAASAQINRRTTRAALLGRKPAWQRDFVMN